jgi:hypothetical protein
MRGRRADGERQANRRIRKIESHGPTPFPVAFERERWNPSHNPNALDRGPFLSKARRPNRRGAKKLKFHRFAAATALSSRQ